MNLSLIICTYNPDEKTFCNCLDAIQIASLVNKPYEIIIIDNNSSNKFRDGEYLKKFCKDSDARLIVEHEQGLTPARLRGIRESTGDILVFIDDDNFIASDFIERGLQISKSHPHIGAWSGQVRLIFEKQPEEWTRKYWGLLVHREIDKDMWSNFPDMPETMPCGAGLFIRKNVAEYYFQLHKEGKRIIQLDRKGSSLFSGGDNDMAACACDMGMGVGLFHKLVLDHYIPAKRTELNYLLQLAEGIAASGVVFRSFRGVMPQVKSIKNKIANILRKQLKKGVERAFFDAVERGELQGIKMLKN